MSTARHELRCFSLDFALTGTESPLTRSYLRSISEFLDVFCFGHVFCDIKHLYKDMFGDLSEFVAIVIG